MIKITGVINKHKHKHKHHQLCFGWCLCPNSWYWRIWRHLAKCFTYRSEWALASIATLNHQRVVLRMTKVPCFTTSATYCFRLIKTHIPLLVIPFYIPQLSQVASFQKGVPPYVISKNTFRCGNQKFITKNNIRTNDPTRLRIKRRSDWDLVYLLLV